MHGCPGQKLQIQKDREYQSFSLMPIRITSYGLRRESTMSKESAIRFLRELGTNEKAQKLLQSKEVWKRLRLRFDRRQRLRHLT